MVTETSIEKDSDSEFVVLSEWNPSKSKADAVSWLPVLEDESGLLAVGKAATVLPSTVRNSKAGVRWTCGACGASLPTLRMWVLHHFEQDHRKMIRWMSHFRSQCIDSLADDWEPTMGPLAEDVGRRLRYSQEMFQADSDTLAATVAASTSSQGDQEEARAASLVCGVCCQWVEDMEEHVLSLDHNESFLNIICPDKLLKVKLATAHSSSLDNAKYQEGLLNLLETEMPLTGECPMELVAVSRDQKTMTWLAEYLEAMKTVRWHNGRIKMAEPAFLTEGSSTVFKKPEAPGRTELEHFQPDDPLFRDNDNCLVCRSKHFSNDSWNKHMKLKAHNMKVLLYGFLKSKEAFEICGDGSFGLAGLAAESEKDPLIGVDSVHVFQSVGPGGSNKQAVFWICDVCYTFSGTVDLDSLTSHLKTVKHRLNFIDRFYADVKPVAQNFLQMNNEIKNLSREILDKHGLGDFKVAVLKPGANKTLESIAALSSAKENTSGVENQNDEVKSTETPLKASEDGIVPKILSTGKDQDLLWCEACWIVIVVDKSRTHAQKVWSQHTVRDVHKNKVAARKDFQFDEANFSEKYSPILEHILRSSTDTIYAGLNEIVHRIDAPPGKEYACVMCMEWMDEQSCLQHMAKMSHIIQFIHKYYPDNVPTLLMATGKTPTSREADINEFVISVRPAHRRDAPRLYDGSVKNFVKSDDKSKDKSFSKGDRQKNGEKEGEARRKTLRRSRSRDKDLSASSGRKRSSRSKSKEKQSSSSKSARSSRKRSRSRSRSRSGSRTKRSRRSRSGSGTRKRSERSSSRDRKPSSSAGSSLASKLDTESKPTEDSKAPPTVITVSPAEEFVVPANDDSAQLMVKLSDQQKKWFKIARHAGMTSVDSQRLFRLIWAREAVPLSRAPSLAKPEVTQYIKKEVIVQDRELKKIQQTFLNTLLPLMQIYHTLPPGTPATMEIKKELKLVVSLIMTGSHKMDMYRLGVVANGPSGTAKPTHPVASLADAVPPPTAAVAAAGDGSTTAAVGGLPAAGVVTNGAVDQSTIRSAVCHLIEQDSIEPIIHSMNPDVLKMPVPAVLAAIASGGGGSGRGSKQGGAPTQFCYNYSTGQMICPLTGQVQEWEDVTNMEEIDLGLGRVKSESAAIEFVDGVMLVNGEPIDKVAKGEV